MVDATTEFARPLRHPLRAWLSETWSAWCEAWAWASIYEHHRKAGHSDPRFAAEQEIYLRGEFLERFRDYASDAYLNECTDLDTAKAAFIKERLTAKVSILDTATTAAIRAVIRSMPVDEAYHEPALRKLQDDDKRSLLDTMAEAEKQFGPGGYTPLERRVLRGHN